MLRKNGNVGCLGDGDSEIKKMLTELDELDREGGKIIEGKKKF